ncbi:hypothetical protein EDB80DRAFT_759657 [Ilyonectria destructans]|nr:hypothetical protein EDB80DRAFT_759657 [Ilyonectria destructans]
MDAKKDTPRHGAVIDIGGSLDALRAPYSANAKPVLPDELLYDDVGPPIWNEIIFTPEFYQTHDEIVLFDKHGADIAARVQQGITVVDLGAGDTRKVGHVLAAFDKAKVDTTYLALDISKCSLHQNIEYLVKEHSSAESTVTCAGIWGSFHDGMKYLEGVKSPRLFLSLGSVLCNDPRPEALSHLKFWANSLRTDFLLIGMDGRLLPNNREKIWNAYHSSDDLYQFFLPEREEDWEFLAELEEEPTTRHRFYFRAKRDINLEKIGRVIKKDEEFDWFDSHKYGEDSVRLMCYKAGLSVIDVWQAPNSEFRQYLVRKKGDKDQRDDADSAVSGVN